MGVAAAICVELDVVGGDGATGGARIGSPPQLVIKPQTSAIDAARNGRRAVGAAGGRRSRQSPGRCESLSQPTLPRPLPSTTPPPATGTLPPHGDDFGVSAAGSA